MIDAEGNAIANAKIILNGKHKLIAVTNEKGEFSFSNIPLDEYELSIMLSNGETVVFNEKVEILNGSSLKVELEYISHDEVSMEIDDTEISQNVDFESEDFVVEDTPIQEPEISDDEVNESQGNNSVEPNESNNSSQVSEKSENSVNTVNTVIVISAIILVVAVAAGLSVYLIKKKKAKKFK